jgi:predicted DCC family thiol-disulfide oxidoreductase YuxK
MDRLNKNILLFDGVCNLCNGMVRFTLKRDPEGKFKFAALQSESGRLMLAQFDLAADDIHSIVFIQGDTCYLKSSAILRILKELGGGWKLFYMFLIIPRPVRDFFYNLVARSRYQIFGKRETCMVPTPEIQERFLN